jgi:hypothetical protein
MNGKRAMVPLLIYSLYIPSWTARGKDDDMTTAAKESKGIDAKEQAGNFIKVKLDCPELKAVNAHLGRTRVEFYGMTAPWGEIKNVRAGKVENHMKVMQWCGDRQAELEPLKDALKLAYHTRIEEERFKLQGAFKESDYPPVEEVLGRFRIALHAKPLTDVNDIRVLTEIPEHERARLEDEIRAEQQKSVAESVGHAISRLLPKVTNLAKQLQDYQDGKVKRLFESLVDNVAEAAQEARQLNLCDADEVEAFAKEAEELVRGLTKEVLKESDKERVATQKRAADLAERMNKFYGAA